MRTCSLGLVLGDQKAGGVGLEVTQVACQEFRTYLDRVSGGGVPSHSEEGKIRVASALQNVRKKRSSQRSVCALSSAARILFASIPGIGSCVFAVNSPLLNERAPRWSSVGQRSSARTQPRRQGALSEGNMRAKQTAPSSTVRGI